MAMSAILGRVNFDAKCIPYDTFKRAFETLDAWGKDGRSIQVQGAVAFGHQRLMLKPAKRGDPQPLWLGQHCILADVVLDNHAEVCDQLGVDVSLAAGISDSRLILMAYQRWGEASVKRLLGDFAFAIWDSKSSTLFAARDVAGARPLFYATRGFTLLFGTTVEAINAMPDIAFEIDEARVASFLAQPMQPQEGSFIKGVEFLPPGHTLIASVQGVKVDRYWLPEQVVVAPEASLEEYAEQLRGLIEQAIDDRLCLNHPVGSHVSGGLDSSGVSVLAHRLLRSRGSRLDMSYAWAPLVSDQYPVITNGLDERTQIMSLCEREGFSCAFGTATADDYLSFFQRNLAFENSADLFEELPLMEQAAGRGTRVMLSGWGGDECVTFGLRGYAPWLLGQRRFKDLLYLARTRGGGLRRPLKMSMFIFRSAILPFCSDRVYARFTPYLTMSRLESLANPEFMARYPEEQRGTSFIWREARDPFTMQCALLRNGHISARMSLWSIWAGPLGIQYRYPLMDKRLLEFSLSLPPDMLWQQRRERIVYQRAMHDVLPERVSKHDTANEAKRKRIRFDCWKKLSKDVGQLESLQCPWLDMQALSRKINDSPSTIEDFDLMKFIPLNSGMRVLGFWRQWVAVEKRGRMRPMKTLMEGSCMSVDLDSKVRRNPDILTAVVDEEIVMMSADQGQYFGLSAIGAYIWNITMDPIQVKELIEMLCQSYDVNAEACTADTLPFLDNMIHAGLMNVVDQ